MWYQVGCPWMFDGKMFFPCTGMPILKNDRSSVRLAVWLPVPLAVATAMEKSLTTAVVSWPTRGPLNVSGTPIPLRTPPVGAGAMLRPAPRSLARHDRDGPARPGPCRLAAYYPAARGRQTRTLSHSDAVEQAFRPPVCR